MCVHGFPKCLVIQSCPTLCDPMDYSSTGSSVHRDSPGKNTGVCCHALLRGNFPIQGLNPGLPHYRQILYHLCPRWLNVNNPPGNTGDEGDTGSIPGSGRSPGEGNGNPLQYSCLKNSMDREAWWATVHGSQTVGHD